MRTLFNQYCFNHFEPYQLVLLSVILTYVLVQAVQTVVDATNTEESCWKILKTKLFRGLIRIPLIKGYADSELNKTVRWLMFHSIVYNFK